jgi:hypothetical protein
MWFKLKQIGIAKSNWNNPIANWQKSLLTQATKQPTATVETWAEAQLAAFGQPSFGMAIAHLEHARRAASTHQRAVTAAWHKTWCGALRPVDGGTMEPTVGKFTTGLNHHTATPEPTQDG